MLQIDPTSFLHFTPQRSDGAKNAARDIFYDETSKTVFTVTSSEQEILIEGKNKDLSLYLKLKAAPHSVFAPRLAPGYGILAVQRAPNIVEFRNVNHGVKGQDSAEVTQVDPESYFQSAKGKDAEILGLEFVGPNEVIFVTDAGLELFQIVPAKRVVKSLKIYNVSVKWFVYSAECCMLLIAAGTHGNLMYPFHVKGASLMKLPKFEVELYGNPQRQTTRILEQDLAIALLYGDVYVLVLRHNPRPGTKGADILMYRFDRENNMEAKLTSLLCLANNGRFGTHVIDNLVIMHEQTKGRSYVFDIATNGAVAENGSCMMHEPVLGDERISAPNPENEAVSSQPSENHAQNNPVFNPQDLYADSWSMFQPNVIVDSSRGFLFSVSLDLEKSVAPLRSDPIRLVEFLIHRREARKVLLNYLRDAIEDHSIRLDQWTLICSRINGIYYSASQTVLLNANQASQVQTLNQKSVNGPMERFSYCLVIDQTAIYSRVFFPLSDSKMVDKDFLCEVIVGYLYSLHAKGLDTESFLYELLVQSLVRSGQFQRLLQLLQYHVLPESKPLAFLLLSLEGQYPPMFNLAVDLLLRIQAFEEIVEIYLSKKRVLQALRFAQLTGCIDNMDPMRFCETAYMSGEGRQFLTVFRFFQQRSLKVKGTNVFGKGEAYDKFERCFEEMFGSATVE